MSHTITPPCKHSESLTKINTLLIDIKLHLIGIREMSKEKIENLDTLADDIRKDLERCKETLKIRY